MTAMGTGNGGGGEGFPRASLEVPRVIHNVQRRISLDKEIRRGIGRATLDQLETLAATLRSFELRPSVVETSTDGVEPGSYFEGDFGGENA